MRLHKDDISGDDIEKALLVVHGEIYLDGQPQQLCIMADEEKGEIECYIARDDPRWKGEWTDLDYWPTEMKYGKVEIRDGRNSKPPSQEA